MMKPTLTCLNKRCENYLKDIEKEKELDRICENGYFFKRCDKCGDIAMTIDPGELCEDE